MKKSPASIVKLNQLSFRYRSNLPFCLKDISFQLNRGDYLVILGKNGSGKSTLGNLIAGLYSNYRGKIELFEQTLNEASHLHLIRKIGFVFQNPESQFIGNTVENDLVFGLETFQLSPNIMPTKIQQIAERMKIKNILYDEPASLSGGEKQKVAFASVLINDPELLIFDEPTSLLDQSNKEKIFAIIDELRSDHSKTLIEITHNIERALNADKILILDKGKIKFFGDFHQFTRQGLEIMQKISGLEIPFLSKLSLALRRINLLSQPIWKNEEMVQTLCRLKKLPSKI